MHQKVHDILLATLIYSDIFDYPLTQEELWKYLVIANSHVTFQTFQKELEILVNKKTISKVEEYFCLPGNEKIVPKRNGKKQLSQESLKKATQVCTLLSSIPTILFIGVSGSLAMENIDEDADIDLFFITVPNTLWITRCIILIMLQLLGIRRKRDTTQKKGVICANMLLDSHMLVLPEKKQNLYTAHEIAQLKPLLSINNTYQKFVQDNNWVKKYLYNFYSEINKEEKTVIQNDKTNMSHIFSYLFITCSLVLEPIARFLQFHYMKKHITSEIVGKTFLAFHPVDYEKIILNEYKKRLEKYKISFTSF